MKRISKWLDRRKSQTFIHMATYRFREVFPGGLAGRTHDELVRCILSAVEEVCRRHRWRLVAWDGLPDRVEVLLTGREVGGETGEGVAAALDCQVYSATGARAVAH